MAAKDKKPAKATATKTKVTRITADTATSDKKAAAPAKKPAATAKKTKTVTTEPKVTKKGKSFLGRLATPFVAIGRYFKGAWYELKQVRWPTRRATWSFTGALLVFTAFFVVLILLLDALFKYLFELMLG